MPARSRGPSTTRPLGPRHLRSPKRRSRSARPPGSVSTERRAGSLIRTPSYRILPAKARNLQLAHWSPNFDRVGIAADLNVAYPADRLDEMAADGVIGSVAPNHVAFTGNQEDTVSRVRLETGPAAAAELKAQGVDVVLLTPV